MGFHTILYLLIFDFNAFDPYFFKIVNHKLSRSLMRNITGERPHQEIQSLHIVIFFLA
jgi:hypothetical protein